MRYLVYLVPNHCVIGDIKLTDILNSHAQNLLTATESGMISVGWEGIYI